MALAEGFVPGRAAEVDSLEVFEDGVLVVFDGAGDIVGAAPEQATRGLMVSVHRVHGDDPPGEVEAGGELAPGRGFVALGLDLCEDHAGAMLGRRDRHSVPVFSLFRGAAQVLPVHGERGMRGAVLAGPPADGVV